MGADGGPVQTICESGGAFSGAWGRQGTILFTKEFGDPIVAVSAAGGTPRPVTALDPARGEVAHFHPAFLPDGRHFVFVARNLDPEKTSVVLASLDSKEVRRLFHADSAAVFADPDTSCLRGTTPSSRGDSIPGASSSSGTPFPRSSTSATRPRTTSCRLSAAGNRVAYLSWSMRRRLVWVDRKGRELGTLGDVGGYEDVRISPDGRRVAVPCAIRRTARTRTSGSWMPPAGRVRGSPPSARTSSTRRGSRTASGWSMSPIACRFLRSLRAAGERGRREDSGSDEAGQDLCRRCRPTAGICSWTSRRRAGSRAF